MAMTVKDLKHVLEKVPDDQLVILAKDAEGNGFSPLDNFSVHYHYVAVSTYSGDAYYEPEDTPEGAVPVLLLWPAN